MMQKEACVTSGQFEKDCKPDDKGMKVAGEMLELYRVVETQSQALQIDSKQWFEEILPGNMTGGSDMEKSNGYFKLPILDYAFKLGCFLLSRDSRTVEQHVDWSPPLYDSNDKVEYTGIPIIYGLYGDEIDYDDSNNEKISSKESFGNS
ncbi:hypothetical protein Peur_021263 [Populus x canadensis]